MKNDSTAAAAPESPTWRNWSRNIEHEGKDYYFRPKNLDELKQVIADAKKKGVTVRASGQRHSQTPLVTSDNRDAPPASTEVYLVDMSCYVDLGENGIELGPGENQVTVNPGVREDDLDAFLTENNLMMETVTAGGFFSLGGMTAVDVHGATVNAPIFAETASGFMILGADGEEMIIDKELPDVEGASPLQFARVSLGALGIVTRITIDVLPRPSATTLQGGKKRFLLEDKPAFIAKYQELLTKHDRVESFYTPYAAAPNLPVIVPAMENFLALWWDVVENPQPQTSNTPSDPEGACKLSEKESFGAPLLGGLGKWAEPYIRECQYVSSTFWPTLERPAPPAAIPAIALDEIEIQVAKANENHSDLWLSEAARVMFMSYFIELPKLDEAGLGKVWDGMEAVANHVIQDGNFHIVAPMEFRFVKGGDSAMSGTFTTNPEAYFVNLDLIGFTEPTPGADYPEELLKFFAMVERKWVSMGGLPHNGKMYGFYDPSDSDANSFTAPFNRKFLSFITERRIQDHGAPVEAFKKYRKACDPNGLFDNAYLRDLLGA